jgi:photosystem II stability/assembly factor-like uncharacterized protein
MSRMILLTMGVICAGASPGRAGARGFVDPLEAPAEPYPRAAQARLTAIVAAGERLVAVGPSGRVLLSDDGGKEWRQAGVPTRSDLVAVRFVSVKRGWAVGHDGLVLATVDGGESWTKQLDGNEAAQLMKAHYAKCAAQGDAKAAALLPEIERLVQEGADKPFFDVLFLDEHDGFAVGAFNLVFRSVDGGKSWQPLYDRTENPDRLHIYSLSAYGGHVYAVGERGLIMRWDNTVERFQALHSPYNGSFFGSLATGTGLVVFGMRGSTFRTSDGGRTWNHLAAGLKGGVTAGAVLGGGAWVLVSQAGEVALTGDDGKTFVAVRATRPMPYFGVASARDKALALVGATGVAVETNLPGGTGR